MSVRERLELDVLRPLDEALEVELRVLESVHGLGGRRFEGTPHLGFAPHDNAQATVFFSLTGLHGAHVFVGLTLLLIASIRSFRGHYTAKEHRGVEVPGIYWHFVDVMWLFVFSTIYVL